MTDGTKPTSFRLPAALTERLREHVGIRNIAGDPGISRTDVVIEALTTYLDGYDDELRIIVEDLAQHIEKRQSVS